VNLNGLNDLLLLAGAERENHIFPDNTHNPELTEFRGVSANWARRGIETTS